MSDPSRVEVDGINVRKQVKTYPSHSLVLYYIRSDKDHLVDATMMDQIPLTVSCGQIHFYPEFGSHEFELYADNQVVWQGEIEPSETIIAGYTLAQQELHQFDYPPEIVSVRDPPTEDQEEALLWRSTAEPVSKTVVDSSSISTEEDDGLLTTLRDVLSHDVQNLLMVAQGQLALAQKTGDEDHFDETADVLNHIDDLIADLLSLADVGHQVTAVDPVELEAVACQAWQDVPDADATLEIDSTGTIVADKSSLRQLLDNLYRNAIDHGGEDVTIHVGQLNKSGFYVEDDGSGIPETYRDRIFQAGYSTDDQSGLGLSIVHRLAEGHGWSIDVGESSAGGARFEFTPE